jgi:hypothetical protein
MLPTPEEIRETGSHPHILRVEPWIAAHLSDLWQSIRKGLITQTTVAADKARHHKSQLKPASAQNQS